jgi:hypothetical protein
MSGEFWQPKDVTEFLRPPAPLFSLNFTGTVDDDFCASIDLRWTGEMPLTMINDKTGKLRYFHNDARTYAQFEKDVQSVFKYSQPRAGAADSAFSEHKNSRII